MTEDIPQDIFPPYEDVTLFAEIDNDLSMDAYRRQKPVDPYRWRHAQDFKVFPEFLFKLTRNDELINQRKLELRLANINATANEKGVYNHRKPPASPYLIDKTIILSTKHKFTAGHKNGNIIRKINSRYKDRITCIINFPRNKHGNYFSSTYLPVVGISLAHSDIRKSSIVINDIRPTKVSFDIIEFDPNRELHFGVDFNVTLMAIGIKGKYWGADGIL